MWGPKSAPFAIPAKAHSGCPTNGLHSARPSTGHRPQTEPYGLPTGRNGHSRHGVHTRQTGRTIGQTKESEQLHMDTHESTNQPTAETIKADVAGTTPAPKPEKPKKFSIPFLATIFKRPEREVKIERLNKKGEKTGVMASLVAEVLLPLMGNILTVKTGVWCDTRFDRDAGGYVDTYSLSLPRNSFTVSDEGRKAFDEWRDEILREGGQLDTWLSSPEAKSVMLKSGGSTPRLVKIRKVENPING